MNTDKKDINTKPEIEIENDINLEIIELEDKIAPRNWDVYAMLNN
ncbi:hypothetical protein [Clostridium sp. KNHs214]|nr:hypothetical protein [Clostridium sp. KNHs214]